MDAEHIAKTYRTDEMIVELNRAREGGDTKAAAILMDALKMAVAWRKAADPSGPQTPLVFKKRKGEVPVSTKVGTTLQEAEARAKAKTATMTDLHRLKNVRAAEAIYKEPPKGKSETIKFAFSFMQPPPPPKPKPTLKQTVKHTIGQFRWTLKNVQCPLVAWLERPTGRRLTAELVALGLELNRPDFTVFVRYSGHVSSIDVECIPGGYRTRQDKDGRTIHDYRVVKVFDTNLPGEGGKYRRSSPKQLRAAIKLLKALSDANSTVRVV